MSPWWLLIAFAIFLIGITKSGFGSGTGLMIVPMTALAMAQLPSHGTKAALALLLPLLICGDLIAIFQYRRVVSMQVIRRLLPGTLAGVILGALLLTWFVNQAQRIAEALVNIEIGVECIILVSLHWYRVWRAKGELPPYRPSLLRSTGTGAFAGVSSTLAHAAGPIIALHLLPQRLDRAVFVGTTALYFAMLNIAKLPAYFLVPGLFQQTSPLFALSFLPLVLLGALIGVQLNRRLSDQLFTRIVYFVTFALGWYILAKGLWQLAHARA